jgi:signal transduction histidine kinase
MKIATRLKLAALIPVLMALIIGFALFFSFRAVQEAQRKERAVQRIITGMNELSSLVSEYVLYREERSLQQFMIEHDRVMQFIPAAGFGRREQHQVLESIRRDIESMKDSFLKLVANRERHGSPEENGLVREVENRLAGRLLVWSRDVVKDASYLGRLVDEQLTTAQRRINLLVFALIVVTTLFLTIVLLGITRSISGSISMLRKGTEVIGAGNLDHRVAMSVEDEIGELSRSFDHMTERLQVATVSKHRLQEEVEERKKAEQELEKSRSELERRVKERTAELERRGRELEDFTFIASHDLQEPLRKIRTFGDLLLDKTALSLDDRSRDYLHRMQKSAARMQTLLKSLLDYSRVSRKENRFNEIALANSVEEALINLELAVQEKKAHVEVCELPTVEADSGQMTQLFQNLISNALKFQRPNETPRVRVYAHALEKPGPEKGKAYEICVEDNGIGFEEEKYLEKVFAPFQRLHGKDAFEGVGIGLAICRKIVERHGGTLTARSTPGKGSTFIITLPGKG